MEEDVMENRNWCFDFTQVEENFPDNLSFSLESLYKILDEEAAPSTLNSSGILECSHLEKLEFQGDHEALHPQPESWPSGMRNPYSLVKSQCDEPLFGHPSPNNGISNYLSGPCCDEPLDERNCSTSQHGESDDPFSLPSVHSTNWLRAPSIDFIDSAIDSYDSFGSFVTDDANFHKLQNNSANYSFSVGSANLDKFSSSCMLQMRETSLVHSMLGENYGSNSERCYDMNNGALPYSTVQNGSICSNFAACRPEDPALHQQYKDSPEVDCKATIRDSHDADNSSQTIPGDVSSSAEGILRLSSEVQVNGIPHDKVALLHGKNMEGARLFLSEDSIKCTVQEQSPISSILDDPVVDMDELLHCGLCAQQCSCVDKCIMSESSTDSSPLPYNHKPLLVNLDGSSVKSRQLISDHKLVLQKKIQKSFLSEKKQPQISNSLQQKNRIFKVSKVNSQSNPSRNSTLDDDTDLFILDDITHSVPPASPPVLLNSQPMTQRFSDYHAGSGTLRTRPDDERLTFRLALQDISQPKAEASPPDGVLAVPLLRHQRIALSWMVQKETAGLNCSGGILADDQGLGKTISTIALILTERFHPSSCSVVKKKYEVEPLNLDDEDDGGGNIVFESCRTKQLFSPSTHVKPEKVGCSIMPVKGRPAAGTLVVCPTSVLRQWADELQNKITGKAKFSFLVYHGNNRTKDPYELAKYDVVVTTYAIVSMEVPKQTLVDKDEMEKEKYDGCSILAGNLANNKRKEPPSTTTKNSRRKITSDSSMLEFSPRPLAKVGWFRVILDEAQSIKNHRTQVARACWGLRAKRRWCLSGTPIQNAIDDLYSYFRFLRYDPYAVYKYFCSTIKIPISRNPINGYKKLQAVLKTVMLRRTKGTLLDGKPIITLPPKTVVLKRVDFSDEELQFYLTLEAESREQFKVYAAAGTVKQNYVNILLMLLRLRQACDHPLLVKGHDLSSVQKSSFETAKKLPKEKIMNLLNCLEACLAICTICNDPPEDAVVSICGHVFCNQCICEHLTGDDSICPSVNCRDKLSVGLVFSIDTLRKCLSEQPQLGFFSDNFISDVEHGLKVPQGSLYSSSSKIRAALDILHSLPLSKTSPSLCESAKPYLDSSILLENTIHTVSSRRSSDTSTDQQSIFKDSNIRHTEKAIIFSQWTRMLDLLEISLKDSCIMYRRLDGTMSVASREKAIKDFNRLPEVTVIIMSLKAASLGLNMVSACHVVLLDLWWNPTTEDQAIDRAHRIGQTRPVTVSRLTVKGTVEDRILALQEKKRKLVASAFGEDESGSQQTRLTVEDLKYLFMG